MPSGGGRKDLVLFGASNGANIGNYYWRAITYTDNNDIIVQKINSTVSVNTSDFSCSIGPNADFAVTLTIKKAGKYEINSDGTKSIVTKSADSTVSIPAWSQSYVNKSWTIRKI